MSDSDGSNAFTSFMTKNNGGAAGESGGAKGNKTEQSLQKAKDEAEEKKNKELNDAKKESAFKASRYNQADATKRKFQEMILLLPFIIFAAIALIYLVTHGGDIINKLFNVLFNEIIGGKK